jgi:CHAT domain-containing protein/tetratricopeptide (TPR) repeat protein
MYMILVLGHLVFGSLTGQCSGGEADTGEERIDSLRCAGMYSEALDVAGDLFAFLEADSNTQAFILADAGRLLETLRMISSLPLATQEKFAEADRMTGRYSVLYENGYVDSAATVAGQQLSLRKQLYKDDHIEVAESMSNYGFFLQESGKREEAVELYRKAIAIEEEVLSEGHPDLAIDYMNLAGVLHELTMLTEAEFYYRKALQIFILTEGDGSDNAAWALGSLGILLKDRGEYETAEIFFKNALITYQALYGDIDYDVGRTMNSLGVLYQVKGEYAEAEPLLFETLKIYREVLPPDDVDIALVLSNIASLMQDKGDYGSAVSYYLESLRIYEVAGESEYLRTVTLNNLADLYHDIGEYAKADSLYGMALEIRQSLHGTSNAESARIILNRARNCRDMGDFESAEPLYRESERLFRSCLSDSNPLIAMHQFSYSNYFTARGMYGEAEEVLLDAIPVYESSRRRLSPGLSRSSFQNSPYPMLSNALLRQGKIDDAWPGTEKYFGRALVDLLFASDLELLTFEERQVEDSLSAVVGGLENILSAYQSESDSSGAGDRERRIRDARLSLLKAESAWSVFQREMAEKYEFSEVQVFSLERIQNSLPDRTAIMGWLDIEERKGEFVSWIYVVRNTGPVIWAMSNAVEMPDSRSPHDRMWMFRSALTQPRTPIKAVEGQASRVWEERFLPVEKALDEIDHLVIIPSGAMLGIPVEAVVDEAGSLLVDRFSISYTPSATIFSWLAENNAISPGGKTDLTLCIGDPPFNEAHLKQMQSEEGGGDPGDAGEKDDYDRSAGALARDAISSLPRLPGTRSEVEAIARIAPNSILLLGPEASEERLYRMSTESDSLKRFAMIHIASHAIISDEAPERSFLVLSQCGLSDHPEYAARGEKKFDGLVSTREIINEWDLDAGLVTLSACETGLGKSVGGEGYIGFSNALLQAGARSLVVSLWKVEDRATALLMTRFYENYLGRYEGKRNEIRAGAMGKADALREAKNWLRNYSDDYGAAPYEHPYFWAAFILIGSRDRH